MKRVFSTSAEVAHIWAQQNQNNGRTSKGHCFFEGAFIWSYGKHYCLGAILTNKKGEKLAVLNDDNSSLTTNGQRHEVRSAACHYNRAYTTHGVLYLLYCFRSSPLADYSAALVRDVGKHSTQALIAAAKSAAARRKAALIENDIAEGLRVFENGKTLLAFYGLKPCRNSARLAEKLRSNHAAVLKQHARAIAKEKKEREKAAKLRQAENDAKALAALDKWRKGERLEYIENKELFSASFIALRVNNWADSVEPYIESSRNASFPVAHALKAFPLIRAQREKGEALDLSGHTIKLGSYGIDAIAANGDVKAGCHFVKWAEIELIARQLKVFP